jgi:hypothetical protein
MFVCIRFEGEGSSIVSEIVVGPHLDVVRGEALFLAETEGSRHCHGERWHGRRWVRETDEGDMPELWSLYVDPVVGCTPEELVTLEVHGPERVKEVG